MTDTHSLLTRRTLQTGLFESTLAIIVAVKARWQAAATRRTLAELTRDQMDDIGYPPPNRPTLEIKAGTMTNLMSMR
ncbi:hypothetical protein [Rhizobium fabae]|uniref:Uncharacterized protein YjiS (DUF1127 family) n=1 Tax=Rhizobium fabae TaxID=573179 RepID=A0A7W6B9L9_9HYPH|nr:hypothetical protein [Rhizobium fabae]MBB3918327.1 uncharacterized protein YjiS (DUF1127 family) [Rhizobium fabae]RUM08577.1 hypothetical protein EFB14_28020 [Rhizobium fabae]